MFKEKNYKEMLDSFFMYYQEQCERFIREQDGSFSRAYFSDWYKTKGSVILHTIKEHLSISRMDDRVMGFIDLYRFFIESARNQNDVDLLLENLFTVPGQMQHEFSEFGFLVTEALTDEQDWLGANQEGTVWDIALTIKQDVWRKTQSSFRYVMESDSCNRALLV